MEIIKSRIFERQFFCNCLITHHDAAMFCDVKSKAVISKPTQNPDPGTWNQLNFFSLGGKIPAQEQMLMSQEVPEVPKRAWWAVVERSVKMEKNWRNQSCPFFGFSQFSRIHNTFGNHWCFKHFYQKCLTRLELFHMQAAEKVGGARSNQIFASKMLQNNNSKYGRNRNHTKDRTSTVFRILETWVYDQLWEDFHMKRNPKSQRLKVFWKL